MYILGIETSCDETGVALFRHEQGELTLCGERLSSQIALHAQYGGVVPELASREHLKALPILTEDLLSAAGILPQDLACIAATRGPGLKGCLLAGYTFAKGMACATGAALLGVHHIEGHLLVPLFDNPTLTFPFLALVVSGGHTELLYCTGLGEYELLARTTDDAAGEAFDKSAYLLGFPYPGGAALARYANEGNPGCFSLPKVMRGQKGFSFSGLKTAISLLVKKEYRSDGDENVLKDLCAAIQQSIIDALLYKLEEAIKTTQATRVVVTGGVSANKALRKRVMALPGIEAYFPTPLHSTDNGAMIGYVGSLRYLAGERTSLESEVVARLPVEKVKEWEK